MVYEFGPADGSTLLMIVLARFASGDQDTGATYTSFPEKDFFARDLDESFDAGVVRDECNDLCFAKIGAEVYWKIELSGTPGVSLTLL